MAEVEKETTSKAGMVKPKMTTGADQVAEIMAHVRAGEWSMKEAKLLIGSMIQEGVVDPTDAWFEFTLGLEASE